MYEVTPVQYFMQISVSVILGIVGITFIVLSVRWLGSGSVSKRLVQYVETPLEEGPSRKNQARIQPRIITGSFSSRIFVPALRGIGRFVGRITPAGAIENLSKQMVTAGNPMGLGPREFYGFNMILTLVGVFLAFVIFKRGTGAINLLLSLLVLILFYAGPKVWLHFLVTSRQNRVRKGLPDALDMLSVCATAGLGFDQ